MYFVILNICPTIQSVGNFDVTGRQSQCPLEKFMQLYFQWQNKSMLIMYVGIKDKSHNSKQLSHAPVKYG